MIWEDQKTKIRRFLRDPNENIWNDDIIVSFYNEIQREIQQKTLVLEDVISLRVPPIFHCSYLHDWEWTYMSPDEGKTYQALRYTFQTDKVVCFRWEEEFESITGGTTTDEGTHITYPWEAWMTDGDVGDLVPIWFPENFDRALLVSWNRRPLSYLNKKRLQSTDNTWITHTGRPEWYWRKDEVDRTFYISPLPSSPSWDDWTVRSGAPNYYYTFSWETSEDYISTMGTGHEWTRYHTDETTEYIFEWEGKMLDGDEPTMTDSVGLRGLGTYEFFEPDTGQEGMVLHLSGDTTTGEVGTLAQRSETIYPGQYGITVDVVDDDHNILLIYKIEPIDIETESDEGDYPGFLQKYIQYGALERLYAVNNDGRIESLRDYWAYRKEIGLRAIKAYMNKRKVDRDYRFTVTQIPGRRTIKHPRLPDEYPAI